jgi:hypothetical protein
MSLMAFSSVSFSPGFRINHTILRLEMTRQGEICPVHRKLRSLFLILDAVGYQIRLLSFLNIERPV